jgi:glycosyltransferase involved in cell wall biosynthesis
MIEVCLATFNGESYIEEQLKSILNSNLVTGVIISDDGSTDETLNILRSISDSRIKIIDGPRKGIVRNFEYLLSHSSAKYIFLSDQDDVWLDKKVELMLDKLNFYDLVISDCIVTDGALKTVYDSYFKSIQYPQKGLLNSIYKNSYIGCCMAIRRSLLVHALPFPKHVVMHDWWLGMVANFFGSVYVLDQPLIKYRRHTSNYSSTGSKSQSSIFLKIIWRLKMLHSLLVTIYRCRANK